MYLYKSYNRNSLNRGKNMIAANAPKTTREVKKTRVAKYQELMTPATTVPNEAMEVSLEQPIPLRVVDTSTSSDTGALAGNFDA